MSPNEIMLFLDTGKFVLTEILLVLISALIIKKCKKALDEE